MGFSIKYQMPWVRPSWLATRYRHREYAVVRNRLPIGHHVQQSVKETRRRGIPASSYRVWLYVVRSVRGSGRHERQSSSPVATVLTLRLLLPSPPTTTTGTRVSGMSRRPDGVSTRRERGTADRWRRRRRFIISTRPQSGRKLYSCPVNDDNIIVIIITILSQRPSRRRTIRLGHRFSIGTIRHVRRPSRVYARLTGRESRPTASDRNSFPRRCFRHCRCSDDASRPPGSPVAAVVVRPAVAGRAPRARRPRPETAGRRPRGRHDQSGRGPVLRDDLGRHGRGRDQGRAARLGRRQPRLRAAVRRRPRTSRPRPAESILRLAEPEQEERVRGLPAARRQDHRPGAGPAVARAHRKLHTRHVGPVSWPLRWLAESVRLRVRWRPETLVLRTFRRVPRNPGRALLLLDRTLDACVKSTLGSYVEWTLERAGRKH